MGGLLNTETRRLVPPARYELVLPSKGQSAYRFKAQKGYDWLIWTSILTIISLIDNITTTTMVPILESLATKDDPTSNINSSASIEFDNTARAFLGQTKKDHQTLLNLFVGLDFRNSLSCSNSSVRIQHKEHVNGNIKQKNERFKCVL